MTNRTQFQFIRLPAWQIWLLSALGLAIGVAIALVAAGLFIILAPVALVAGLIYRLRHGRAPGKKPADPGVIDVEYTVVDPAPGAPGRGVPKR